MRCRVKRLFSHPQIPAEGQSDISEITDFFGKDSTTYTETPKHFRRHWYSQEDNTDMFTKAVNDMSKNVQVSDSQDALCLLNTGTEIRSDAFGYFGGLFSLNYFITSATSREESKTYLSMMYCPTAQRVLQVLMIQDRNARSQVTCWMSWMEMACHFLLAILWACCTVQEMPII
jgi:hypothetical protein